MPILDSGERRQFESGAVRDIQEGKGRCDLLPLDVVSSFMTDGTSANILKYISAFQGDNNTEHLRNALREFSIRHVFVSEENTLQMNLADTFLEVSKHFEEGAKKYGEHNWQKGIPVHCYIDSAVRHYLKHLRGDTDEPHDRAFVWNILCCIWTCIHKPELNEYRKEALH
jgi:hypothetical protein